MTPQATPHQSNAPTFSERMAAYICEEKFENIDEAAVRRTKQVIAYHLGLAFRAIKSSNDVANQAIIIARALSEECGSSTLIGYREKATVVDAVFANCTLMRALGLDDVIFPAGIHPGLMALPVALGVGERMQSSGAEVITSVVTAYEILGKFGKWTWSAQPPRRPTMPFGPFGSIAAAGKLLKLTPQQMTVALAYAAHTAMGLAESDNGPVTHYYSLVCRNAIIGAFAAKAGAWGSPTVLEGKFGFFDAFLGGRAIDGDDVIESLGHDYAIMSSCEKRYPGTGLNHVAIELIRELVENGEVTADEIDTIEFEMPEERRNFTAGHEFGPFSNAGAAASSFAYQSAMVLIDGYQDPERYDDFENPEILSLTGRMSMKFVSGKPIRYTRLSILLNSGKKIVREGDDFRHSPDHTREVIAQDASGVISDQAIERIVAMIDDLENVDDISELLALLRPH